MNKPIVVVGGLALAAAIPAFVGGTQRVHAQCRAMFGSLNDGVCLDQPSDAATGGILPVGIGPTDSGGPGISTSPLFPGQTINVPLGP
ncbi:MAG: hypothetical protein QOE41_4767 [Mycobacterium sp.]|jgi:hypothetical protein|nr:hypothetical protein [Mycobacterium sp.]MDT5135456.1 hypothetical protein [Mycobacterium sp.]